MLTSLIVVHGGYWKENTYEGGLKEFIPVPDNGLKYEDLLNKLEVRMKKDKLAHTFDIDSLITLAQGGIMRMKITDDFELKCLFDLAPSPTIYVNVLEKICSLLGFSMHDNVDMDIDRWVDTPTPITSDVGSTSHTLDDASSKWMIPRAPQEVLMDLDSEPIQFELSEGGKLGCGSTFGSKETLLSAVGMFHLKNFVESRTKRSDSSRYHIVCKFEGSCSFSMRSRSMGKAWRIYEWKDHTCERDLRRGTQIKVSTRAIAEHIAHSTAEDGFDLRPRDIQGQLRRGFGLNLKYPTALAGRNLALKLNYGDHHKSFQMLPKYLYMLELLNPGSVVDLQTFDDFSFQYCYFSLAACVRAFWACRPVIVIDGTHLRGKFKGVLFVASTKDANEQIVPLAFGVGDKENDSSWNWFLEQVRMTFGTPKDFLIVSDQHFSIKNVVARVFPGTPHAFCTYHIQGNIKSWGEAVNETFQKAANAYNEDDYMEHMDNLFIAAPRAHAKLMDVNPTRWARSKCPVRCYRFGTSNAVEVLNARLKWARCLPICSLLEHISNLVQALFSKRNLKSKKRGEELSVYATKRLGFATLKGSHMKVEPISDTKFNVTYGTKSNVVDITLKECSCRVFQLDLFPCSHATAAICHLKQVLAAYVHALYTTHMWRAIYSVEVMPIPNPREWHIPPGVESRVVGTPLNPKQAGRPRTKRMQAGKTSSRVCSRCHKAAHYHTSCNEFMYLGDIGEEPSSKVSEEPSSEVGQKRRRKPKSCGICGVVGHTRRKCNDPNR